MDSIYLMLLALTHLTCAGLGFLGGRLAIRKGLAELAHKAGDTEAKPDDFDPLPSAQEHRLAVWILVGAIVLVGIGAQSYINQRQLARDAQDRQNNVQCLTDWSVDFSTSVTESRKATAKQTNAEEMRDNALDNVVLIVNRGQTEEIAPEEFRKALRKFAVAKRKLDIARDEARKTRDEYPLPIPPTQACGSGAGEGD